jgi:C4-dicarboxylate-specific signal transduction histidine kinase
LGEAPQQFYWCLIKKDGAKVHTEVSLNRFVVGKKQYIQAIVRNITERKHAEKKLEETRKKFLKSKILKAIGTLAGGIAHDFNNTLSITLGNINLAQVVSKDE